MSHSTKHKVTRRTALSVGMGASIAGVLAQSTNAQETSNGIRVSRFEQAAPFPVNAYIVESSDGVVVVDATLTNTSSLALRARVDAIGKPLRGVLLTHAHPDHYAGLGNVTAGLDVPILSVSGVRDVALRDDSAKDSLIGGMFGAEWPQNRVFPTEIASEATTIDLGEGLKFDVLDIGPAESYHDSVFVLQGTHQQVFAGDLAYGLMHPYMADNTNPDWTKALDRLQSELDENAILHIGHGQPVTPGFLPWQASYLARFEEVLKAQDWSDIEAATAAVSQKMREYLPQEHLAFLMELSVAPNAERLGLI